MARVGEKVLVGWIIMVKHVGAGSGWLVGWIMIVRHGETLAMVVTELNNCHGGIGRNGGCMAIMTQNEERAEP
jgi:hypothetical protein